MCISLNVFTPTSHGAVSSSWLVDSGASVHLVNDLSLLHNPVLHAQPLPLHLATSDAKGGIIASGSVCLVNARQEVLWLHNVQCVPSAHSNLLSVTGAIQDGATFLTDHAGGYTALRGPNGWSEKISRSSGLFFVESVSPVRWPQSGGGHTGPNAAASHVRKGHTCQDRLLWHARLGHPGINSMVRLDKEDLVNGIDVSLAPCDECPTMCESCIQGKHVRPPFPVSSRPAEKVLDRVHVDTVGPISPPALTGERFWVTVVDESSHMVASLTVKSKDVIPRALIDLLKYWQTDRGTTVKCVRSDRGSEFMNQQFKEFCVQQGTKMETSAPYTPQQNGLAERMNRTLKERTRTLLVHAAADPSLWKEALDTATLLYNVGPTTGRPLTPTELFHGVKPDVSVLRTFGCVAHVHIPSGQRSVFGPKTIPGMFTGYSPQSKAYRVYVGNGMWKESRDVSFIEYLRGAERVGMSKVQPGSLQWLARASSHGRGSEANHPNPPAGTPVNFWDEEEDPVVEHMPTGVQATTGSSPGDCSKSMGLGGTGSGDHSSHDRPPAIPGTSQQSWSVLGHLQNLARGGDEGQSQLDKLQTVQEGIRLQGKSQHPLPPGTTLTREQRYEQRLARRDPVGVPLHDPGSGQAPVREPPMVGLPDVQRQDETGEALHGVDVSAESSKSVAHESGEEDRQCEVVAKHVHCVQVNTVGAAQNGQERVPTCDSRRERELLNPSALRKVRENKDAACESSSQGGRETHETGSGSPGGTAESQHKVQDVPYAGCQDPRQRERGNPNSDGSTAEPQHKVHNVPSVKLGKVHVPSSLKEAQRSPQWEFWQQAMREEMDSLDTHEVMEYVERPHGQKVIPVHWIFSTKNDAHGNVTRFKARLVAQGCRQIPGIDVGEVFAPTSSYGARRAVLAVAATQNLEIHQVDIKTAFLNGELEEEVYVTQPPGFENGNTRVVCKLRKALYGLKQAPRAWHKTLSDKLSVMGYRVCKSDAGVYIRRSTDGNLSFILVYVDDLLIVAKVVSEIEWGKELLKRDFTIHDLGEVSDFLGCQVLRNRANCTISMSCTPKIDALVEKFGIVDEGRVVETPMSKDFVVSSRPESSDGMSHGAGTPLAPGHRYCELIGSLLYIANTTRPDISQAVGVLSRYRMTPTTSHWNEAIRVLKYLRDTRELALTLGGNGPELEGYVDADYAGDLDHRYSTTGYVLSVYGSAVVWGSKKQSSVATSTVQAEFMAAGHIVKEANWLRGFLEEIGAAPWRVKIFCDNQGCISNLRNPLYSKFTKHVAVSFHYAREAMAMGQVDILYVESARNVADIMTKPLAKPVFVGHRDSLGLRRYT